MRESDELAQFVQNIVRDEVSKLLKNYEKSHPGVVKEVDTVNNRADVDLAGFQGDTGMLKNVTGETLSVGDSVRVYYIGNVANGYIGIKMG